MRILIVHLTDLHLKERIEYLEEKISSLKDIIEGIKGIRDVLFLFTGDIAFSGMNAQYAVAKEFIEGLRVEISSIPDVHPHFAICPGNHDRTFSSDEEITIEDLNGIDSENFKKKLDDYHRLESNYRGFKNNIVNPEYINDVLDRYYFSMSDGKIVVYSLDNSILSAFYRKSNSAYDDNKGRIIIPGDYLNLKRRNEDLNILITHIPLDFLCDETKNHLIELSKNNIDFIFAGHIHEHQTIKIKRKDEGLLEFVSSALHEGNASGFSCFDIDEDTIYSYSYYFDNAERKYLRDGDGEAISFPMKRSTSYSQTISNEFLERVSKITIDARHIYSAEKIFVFPLLVASTYSSKQFSIASFEEFEHKRTRGSVVEITGDKKSGKTVLARHLFSKYVKDGYMPVLLDGNSIRTSIKTSLHSSLKEIYQNKNIVSSFEDVPKDRRVIIIDDLDKPTDKLLSECLEYSDNVIYFKSEEGTYTRLFEDSLSTRIIKYHLEPFFYDKRIQLISNIYSCATEKDPSIKDKYNEEKFIQVVERTLTSLDKDNLQEAHSLSVIAIQLLTRIDIYDSAFKYPLFRVSIETRIQEALEEGKYRKCDLIISERILSDVAYQLYKEKKNSFSLKDFEDALTREREVKGNDPINSIDSFVNMLVSKMVLKNTGDDEFAFYDRAVFAYFIAHYAIERYHAKNDDSCLQTIIQNGIYSPLNFQILLSIATVYNYQTIPTFFVNDLYDEVMQAASLSENSLKKLSSEFVSKKKALIKMGENERKKFIKSRSKNEDLARRDYLENIDNYFYEEEVDARLKKVIEWGNRMQIVSVLLNTFASSLDKEEKDKLVEMAIKLPNIVSQLIVENTINSIDDFYMYAKCALANQENGEKVFEEIRDYMLSMINAVILSLYDMGSKPLNSPIVSGEVGQKLKDGKINHRVQYLMLLSFSSNHDRFIEEATKTINGDNPYLSNCARLIGRRFCFEYYSEINKHHKAFLGLVTRGKGISILKAKMKKEGTFHLIKGKKVF